MLSFVKGARRMSGYWERTLDSRVGRRKILVSGAGLAGAGAILAACGGGESSSKAAKEKASGLISPPVDTTKQAKAGGVLRSNIDSEPQNFDPYFADRGSAQRNSRMQSRLLELKPGVMGPASGDILGDLAESWEMAPDGLQLTMKLVANAHFDPRDPTNGRVVDAQDVIWSWQRFINRGTLRADYFNGINPGAPIVSMNATDPRTVVIKLSEPQAGVLTQLTASSGGAYLVMPREAEDKYNPVTTSRSAGPYLLWDHKPSVGSTYKKNPGFHRDYGYADTIELPIVTENATGLAAFKNGQIYVRSSFPAQDILQAKRDVPQLVLQLADVAVNTVRTMFGWEEGPKSSPFRDVRVRQAFSLAQDRDLFIEAVYNVSKFAAEGISMETRWSTAVPGSDDVWWLDPKSKDFGENSKWYQYNPTESKALLSAAGFSNGLETLAHFITTTEYGLDFQKWIQIIIGMLSEAGIRLTNDPPGYTQDWRPRYADSKGHHDGVAFRIDTGPPDSGDRLYSHYNTNGTLFQGFSADGKSTYAGDPQMDELTNKMRREFDTKKRLALGYELQKLEAKMQYWPFFPGGASNLSLTWPVLENVGVYKGGRDPLVYMWINPEKPPLGHT
jgi:peptide/nickel transport system substrate-binding protein